MEVARCNLPENDCVYTDTARPAKVFYFNILKTTRWNIAPQKDAFSLSQNSFVTLCLPFGVSVLYLVCDLFRVCVCGAQDSAALCLCLSCSVSRYFHILFSTSLLSHSPLPPPNLLRRLGLTFKFVDTCLDLYVPGT